MPSISFSSFSRAEGSLSFLEGATGLLDLDKMIGWIDSLLGGPVDFDHLNIPFVAVATELVTGAMFALNTGSISPAIRASCSVPGIFTPVTRDGRTLVDGVVSNNLPTSVVRGMGADYVIAVDLLPSGGATVLTHKQDRVYVPRNVIDVTMHAIYALIRTTQHDLMTADCHITPAIGHIAFSDLGQQSQMLTIGRQAAEAAIPQILADLKRL
jgi:NTE family protein